MHCLEGQDILDTKDKYLGSSWPASLVVSCIVFWLSHKPRFLTIVILILIAYNTFFNLPYFYQFMLNALVINIIFSLISASRILFMEVTRADYHVPHIYQSSERPHTGQCRTCLRFWCGEHLCWSTKRTIISLTRYLEGGMERWTERHMEHDFRSPDEVLGGGGGEWTKMPNMSVLKLVSHILLVINANICIMV